MAALLGIVGFVLALEGNAVLIALAGGATVIHFVARRMSDAVVSFLGHALFAVAATWLVGRLAFDATFGSDFGMPETMPFLNVRAVSDLTVIILTVIILTVIILAVVSTLAFSSANTRILYRASAHAALLAWMYSELSPLADGQAYSTIAWGIYATIILVAELRMGRVWAVRAGVATLLLVAAKMLVVDPAEVEAIWRILLFLGFGGTFLTLSFFLQSLWKPDESRDERNAA
ncbi:MAG: DUF2339 domain-containing protein [Actinomycetota bacterium]|jgi:hypothetical protein|nr:DUF2339 domain-containing protein [Actinomycetota bacterium]